MRESFRSVGVKRSGGLEMESVAAVRTPSSANPLCPIPGDVVSSSTLQLVSSSRFWDAKHSECTLCFFWSRDALCSDPCALPTDRAVSLRHKLDWLVTLQIKKVQENFLTQLILSSVINYGCAFYFFSFIYSFSLPAFEFLILNAQAL